MSALTDYFTSLANKIRSKVGGSQTYTPLQMVSAIDDVYDAGAASVPSPSSITPSNASPVALTAGAAVKPTTSGYAIESYSSVNPTIGGASVVSNGSIYKMSANGVVTGQIDNLASTAAGASITGGRVYKSTNGGYAYTAKFPSFGAQPDVIWQNRSVAATGSSTITVTQKPRFIFCTLNSNNSNYSVRSILIDVNNNRAWGLGYNGNTAVNEDYSSNISTIFPTISASSVVYNHAWWSASHRANIMIYY